MKTTEQNMGKFPQTRFDLRVMVVRNAVFVGTTVGLVTGDIISGMSVGVLFALAELGVRDCILANIK